MAGADRARRYAQIAERANLRAQIRSEQIVAMMKLEMTPRAAGVVGTGLLIREEVMNDGSLLHGTMRRLRIHCTGNHR